MITAAINHNKQSLEVFRDQTMILSIPPELFKSWQEMYGGDYGDTWLADTISKECNLSETEADELLQCMKNPPEQFKPKDFITPLIVETLPTGYILNSKDIVHPQRSYYDPEGECHFHIWADKRCYYWGIEIEARYTGLGEGTPKIRRCEHISPKVHAIFKELPLL